MFTPNGKTEIPFEIPLKPKGNKPLYETYHGVFVNIQVWCNLFFTLPKVANTDIVGIL